jgi:hypothetical protein
MAEAAEAGGAVAIRAEGLRDISEIKKVVSIPIVGLIKFKSENTPVVITPLLEHVYQLLEAGVDLIAVDATLRKRVDGTLGNDFVAQAKAVGAQVVADIDNLLTDNFRQPSAEWGETFCTLSSNKIKVYTNDEFELANAVLYYYRKPREIAFLNCVNPSTGVPAIADVTCEFKDDIAEMLVDEAAAILAGDIESIMQYQRNKQNSTTNT